MALLGQALTELPLWALIAAFLILLFHHPIYVLICCAVLRRVGKTSPENLSWARKHMGRSKLVEIIKAIRSLRPDQPSEPDEPMGPRAVS